MEIQIAQRLKQLRRKRGNTQDDLARFLGITVQAVSKWECGDGLPDITLLPRIAAYYSVSVDCLLGVDEETKKCRMDEICARYNQIRHHDPHPDGTLYLEHGLDEGIELIRSAIQEFPDQYFFCQLLASDLWWKSKSLEGEAKNAVLEEGEALCRRVLDPCMEDRWRHCAREILCLILKEGGKQEMALNLAYTMPDPTGSSAWILTYLLEGAELQRQLCWNIREFLRLLYLSVKQMQDEGGDLAFLREQDTIQVQLDFIHAAMKKI
ncbi:MAG: helix-turn-helix domain-containing protein [Eubacteriales bacterium]